MFIHFYTHNILIFVLNYDKNSLLNNNVPYVIGQVWMHSIKFSFQPLLQFVWISNNNTH